MKSKGILLIAAACLTAIALLGQTPAPPPAAPQQGPGVQAARDARYPDFIAAKCKTPPAPAVVGPRAATGPFDYTVTEIPGVIAGGQKWKSVWTGAGNNADGIIATEDGGILAAQNTNSDVMKLDKNGMVSFLFKDTNTGGAVSMNKKGALFIVERALPQAVWQLAPKRQLLANMYNGEPFECAGGGINDLSADSKGGAYFTMGGLFYANPKGVVTKQGTVARTNGIILSPDEKTLYVTGRLGGARGGAPEAGPVAGMIAFDVQPDGSLSNERQFAMVGGDGSTIDAAGRVYSTGGGGVQVIGPDGKFLGAIPSPRPLITVAFSGPDKKTLYGVFNDQSKDEIFTIQMIAQGYKGRAK